jgi:hypothetical protein
MNDDPALLATAVAIAGGAPKIDAQPPVPAA